jgi:predicted metal-dependent phosphoesterase TrpH
MGLADLHIHTIYSWDGTSTISAVLKYAADYTDLDVIAITDHDEIAGALQALDLAPNYGISVLPGCEISTMDGHLLALFIQRPVQPGLSLVETVLRVGELGGLCIAAHPLARGINSLAPEAIRSALKVPGVSDVLIGIEVFNASIFHRRSNEVALAFAQDLPMAQVGNSDSHWLQTIGQGATEFAGTTVADLRLALETGATKVHRSSRLASGPAIILKWLPRYLMRLMGRVSWNPTPGAPL